MSATEPVESPRPASSPAASPWEQMSAALQERFPGQRESVLFCVWKLQQNADASLRDFRDEARQRGIPIAGRALHSAKVLLGLAAPSVRRPRGDKEPRAKAKAAPTPKARRAPVARADGSIESTLLAAVRRVQSDAGEEAARLRAAIREAIAVLERALDD